MSFGIRTQCENFLPDTAVRDSVRSRTGLRKLHDETFLLAIAVGLLFWALAGGVIVRGILSLCTQTKGSAGRDALPKQSRQGAREHRLSRPDGSELRIECYGREDAPAIILTHGWGANSTEWDYLKKELPGDFQLIVWDLPGLGRSTRPTNRHYSMENLSRDLEAIFSLVFATQLASFPILILIRLVKLILLYT
jgi:hypothetical protein